MYLYIIYIFFRICSQNIFYAFM